MEVLFEDIDFSSDLFDKVNVKLIKKINLIPYKESDEHLIVLKVKNSFNYNVMPLRLIFKKNIIVEEIKKEEYEKIIDYLTKSSINGFYDNLIINNKSLAVFENKDEFYNNEIKSNVVVRTVENIIDKAILLAGSDVHFEPRIDKCIIRIRIDGELKKYYDLNKELYEQVISRIKVLSNLDITKHLLSQDGKINYKFNDSEYDIRVSIIPSLYGERITLRILDKENNNINLDDLCVDSKSKEYIYQSLESQNGLILVVGATGSGKTTTLYSMLKNKNTENVNIITVEDPIEYSLDGITQVQVDEDGGMTFNDTLRSVLRHDPDIFMVGEIRDEDSAKIAIRSASTGHLVFSSMHANSASSAITRLIDMKVPPYLLSTSLKIIIYQKLFKKICPKCNNKNNEGCSYCNYTGTKGRIAVGEVLKVDDNLRKSILNDNYIDLIDDYIKEGKFIEINENIKNAEKNNVIAKLNTKYKV